MEDKSSEVEIIARDVKERYLLLETAKGCGQSFKFNQIITAVVSALLILLAVVFVMERKSAVSLFLSLCFLFMAMNLILSVHLFVVKRQIKALIELIGEDNLLKFSRRPSDKE